MKEVNEKGWQLVTDSPEAKRPALKKKLDDLNERWAALYEGSKKRKDDMEIGKDLLEKFEEVFELGVKF